MVSSSVLPLHPLPHLFKTHLDRLLQRLHLTSQHPITLFFLLNPRFQPFQFLLHRHLFFLPQRFLLPSFFPPLFFFTNLSPQRLFLPFDMLQLDPFRLPNPPSIFPVRFARGQIASERSEFRRSRRDEKRPFRLGLGMRLGEMRELRLRVGEGRSKVGEFGLKREFSW